MTIEKTTFDQGFEVGEWRASPVSGELSDGSKQVRLEPKVMQLLCLLAERAPEVVAREELDRALWPDAVVGEDALARCLLKLRRALGDNAREPRYVETLPRRGYRLIAPVRISAASDPASTPDRIAARPGSKARARKAWAAAGAALILLITALVLLRTPDDPVAEPPALARAHDHYYRFTQADNERANLLYQRVLEQHPDDAEAQAGLANTLIQRLIRWPEVGGPVPEAQRSVAAALAGTRLDAPWARATLDRAGMLVDDAVRNSPDSGFAWKAHGLVAALGGRTDQAMASYRTALEVDPDNWEAAMNLGELQMIAGDNPSAVANFERAYRIMERGYLDRAQQIGPWQPEVGVLIGALHEDLGASPEAEAWYRRVLESTPLHVEATVALAASRAEAGDEDEAEALCRDLVSRIGPLEDCRPYLPDR